MPYRGIFKVEFEKTIVISKISTLESVIKQSFVQNKETSNLDQNYFIWVLAVCNFEKLLSHLKSALCQSAKFCTKIKILKFGIKNALFWYFGVKFWKTVVIIDISTLKLVKTQKWKSLHLGRNLPYLIISSCYLKNL